MLKRKATVYIKNWIDTKNKKCLVVQGARQTGKTYIIERFAEENFEELCNFANEVQFDRMGCFTYSPEEDTPAASMPDQIDEEVKLDRRDELMELQQEISADRSQRLVGKRMEVIIEGKAADEDVYVGRTYMDAPGVDGYVFIKSEEELLSGDFARVKITKALEYDLIGELE